MADYMLKILSPGIFKLLRITEKKKSKREGRR